MLPAGRANSPTAVGVRLARVMPANATLAAVLLATVTPATATLAEAQTAITIYSSAQPGAVPAEYYRPLPGESVPSAAAAPGYATVSQDRQIDLAAGRSQVRFTDVAALIDPTTVQFRSLSDPDTRVLEQAYQFDLVSTAKLLSRYVDKTVTVRQVQGNEVSEITGVLLAAGDGLVLRGPDAQIHALSQYSNLRFAELPGGLITRPTLFWDVTARKAGQQLARVTYQTAGITWWADYNLTFTPGADANAGFLHVGAWVSIVNQSGADYPEARVKLIAGDVQSARGAPAVPVALALAKRSDAAPEESFAEKTFFEYHLYTLSRRTALPNNSTKQIELFDAANRVPTRKVLVYSATAPNYAPAMNLDRNYGAGASGRIDVYLEFRNDEKSGLGLPLPGGRIRVSQIDDGDQGLEFIGEDVIDHTPKNETVRVRLGSAFDVVGERRQVDFSIDTKARTLEEEIEVKLRNHKTEAVEVLVRERLRGARWTIDGGAPKYDKEDARTIVFPVRIAADAEQSVRYRARYTW